MPNSPIPSTGSQARSSLRGLVGRISLMALAVAMIGAAFGGCSQEQRDNWTWNPFEDKSKTTPPDAGTKARRPADATATASNEPRTTAKPAADDPKAEQVNCDVDTYTRNFNSDRNASRPRSNDSQTPTIDDDRQLADASASRAQRTSARPAPARNDSARTDTRGTQSPATGTTSSSPRSSNSNSNSSIDSGDDLVLIPTGSSGSAVSTPPVTHSEPAPQYPASSDSSASSYPETPSSSNSSVQPETTHVAMTTPSTSSQTPEPVQNPYITSTEDTEADEPVSRPPVLGSIVIEAGNENESSDSTNTTDIGDARTSSRPPAPATTNSAQAKPTPIADTKPRVEPKPTIIEPEPIPPPRSATPFEDRDGANDTVIEPIRSEPRPQPKPAVTPIHPTPTPVRPVVANNAAPAAVGTAKQIADLEAIVARQPNNIDQQLKLRMAYLLEGDETRAVTPTPGMSEDVERTVIAQIQSVIAAKSASGRTAPAAANSQLASAEAIRESAAEKADLMVPRVVLCTAIRAFGDYTPIDPPTFPAGKKNKVLVYIEIDNFLSKEMPDGQYRTELSLRESLLDARGRELWSKQTPQIEDINRQPRRDFFVSTGARAIPPSLPPGEYYYKVEIEDLQANKINSGKTQFRLVSVGRN